MLQRTFLAIVATAFAVCAHATDYTDIWWVGKAEDGWGINLAQSDNFIFATFFIYGPGNVPTWYAGNLTLDGTGAFTGGLYSTTGTYFGTVPYNPAQYGATQVGNASFKPTAADKGVLTYNVGGVSVVKNIQRQTLRRIPLGGTYAGAVAVLESGCTNPIDNGPIDVPASITVTQPASGPMTLYFDVSGLGSCTIVSSGIVTQNGALHSFSGTIACTGDPPYALTVSELKATSQGIEGRWTAPPTNDGCQEEGRFSGVARIRGGRRVRRCSPVGRGVVGREPKTGNPFYHRRCGVAPTRRNRLRGLVARAAASAARPTRRPCRIKNATPILPVTNREPGPPFESSKRRPTADGVAPRLALSGMTKAYPSVVANEDVDLVVFPGEIHAVLGENGAGKSTLMKTIYGVVRPDAGEMRWEGEPVVVASPAHARQLGIDMVFQTFSLFETLSVVENIALALPGGADLDVLARRIAAVSEGYGLPVDPRRLVHSLSVGERQRVEIVRCLLQSPKLLIMDEPTSVLTPQAVQRLFATLRKLAREGCSILYISHKLDEIRELCHTATVLRAGRVTGHCVPSRETPESMARMMIGGDLPHAVHGAAKAGGETRLKLAGLSHAADDPFGTDLRDLHLEVRSGEIVGIAGVSGNGQQELLLALSGEAPIAEKHPVQICGVEAGRMGAGRRRLLGLCFVPEERLGRGAVPGMSLAENAILTAARTQGFVRRGLVDFGAARDFAAATIQAYDVKCAGPQAQARSLSGGNLQKYIVGREMRQDPKLLVVAQPTWGVDVGAAAAIRQAIVDLRNRGCAVLLISEELDELFEICDRIAVIAKGRLSPARRASETSVEEIGVWMSGMWPGVEGAAEASSVDA